MKPTANRQRTGNEPATANLNRQPAPLKGRDGYYRYEPATNRQSANRQERGEGRPVAAALTRGVGVGYLPRPSARRRRYLSTREHEALRLLHSPLERGPS